MLFRSVTAFGGGGPEQAGGSGGGGGFQNASYTGNPGASNQISYPSLNGVGKGYSGGAGVGGTSNLGSGGSGGAGSAGTSYWYNSSPSYPLHWMGGTGGDAWASSITGTSTYYSGGGPGIAFYSGSFGTGAPTTYGQGSYYPIVNNPATQGVVIIRANTSYGTATTTGNCTITTVSGNNIYTFTGSGTIKF